MLTQELGKGENRSSVDPARESDRDNNHIQILDPKQDFNRVEEERMSQPEPLEGRKKETDSVKNEDQEEPTPLSIEASAKTTLKAKRLEKDAAGRFQHS